MFVFSKYNTSGKLVVWGPVVRDSRGTLKYCNNPFSKGIPRILTTGPQTTSLPLAEKSLTWMSQEVRIKG